MPIDHSEKGFEQTIEEHLLASGGYVRGNPADFDASLGLDPTTLVAFVKGTQPKAWQRLTDIHGTKVEENVVRHIAAELDRRGSLDCLRHGVKDRGVQIRLAYFKPASCLNPEIVELYGKNVLTVTRQVHYSTKDPALSVDVVLGLNGIPVATAELKNPFTNQNVKHAVRQYQHDRDPKEPLFQFKRRALVHFAVDPDAVFMTTQLACRDTVFLPFNRGREGGAGNPDNPESGWKTAYLWEEVWPRESWLDIVARFVHLEKRDGKESIIFPRFHQLEAVRRLVAAARANGAGTNYLVQHSAGSGKSNTIAWLAHRLASLHGADDKPVYDSVVVVTDRRVLDRQLQDTIYQFEHAQGVVVPITDNSTQLAEALQSGARIVITTLQKFSFVLDKMGERPDRRYAVIADEAHSSQSGETAANLRRALAPTTLEQAEQEEGDVDPTEDGLEAAILKAIGQRQARRNLSFFAFTATPKHKTLELFGTPDLVDGKPHPFHLYTMRQAIEEGFILDVLANYTTYKTYFQLSKTVDDDPELAKQKAVQEMIRYVSLHPHNLDLKIEAIVEHFLSRVRHRIGGRAKAMIVARSRLHAVKYRQAFDRYVKKRGYQNVRALVAFSGTVRDEAGVDFTEAGMNGFSETQTARRFATDEYQFLIVAEKYQTGFDQPLLHTMYVDRRLKGLQAVQTLSRLNRTHPGKEEVFVLDFANEVDDMKDAFKPYYERTEIKERVDPNSLYTLKTKLDEYHVYWQQEVDEFAKVFFKPADQQRPADAGLLHKAVNPAVGRFEEESDERRADFRADLGTFVRLYDFLSLMIEFRDVDLEKLAVFGRFLLPKLATDRDTERVIIDDEVALKFYRLTKTFDGSSSLAAGEGVPVSGPTNVGTGRPTEDARAKLSELIEVLNERFGTDFTPEDQLLFDQVAGDLAADEELAEQARNNTIDQFKLVFDDKALAALIERLDRNQSIASAVLEDEDLRAAALEWLLRKVYERAQEPPDTNT